MEKGPQLTYFKLETPKGVLAKSADQDQMPHNVPSDRVYTILQPVQPFSNKNILTLTPLKLKMD